MLEPLAATGSGQGADKGAGFAQFVDGKACNLTEFITKQVEVIGLDVLLGVKAFAKEKPSGGVRQAHIRKVVPSTRYF